MAYSSKNKQVSIGIPIEVYETIKVLAEKDRRSVSSLCAIVIERYAEENHKNMKG